MHVAFEALNAYFPEMYPTLIEESSSKRIPHNLEALVKSLQGSQDVSPANKKDLLAVLLYVLMLETGYSPINAGETSVCSSDHGFSIQKLNHFHSMPTMWKNIQQNNYEMTFILGRFTQYPCRLLIIPTDDDMIVNLLISNLTHERNGYSFGIQPSKYVIDPTSSCIPRKFSNLKNLSLKFKNNLSHPARSVILTKEGVLNASLFGVPDEVKIKIFKLLKVSDLLNLSQVCSHLYKVTEEQGLWRYFLVRDFRREDVESLVNQPDINNFIIWKEEYRRRYRNLHTRRHHWHFRSGIM
jgi:hypothetical protein